MITTKNVVYLSQEENYIYQRLIVTTVIKLNPCFCFKFSNCSKMSSKSRKKGAREWENIPHNINS